MEVDDHDHRADDDDHDEGGEKDEGSGQGVEDLEEGKREEGRLAGWSRRLCQVSKQGESCKAGGEVCHWQGGVEFEAEQAAA